MFPFGVGFYVLSVLWNMCSLGFLSQKSYRFLYFYLLSIYFRLCELICNVLDFLGQVPIGSTSHKELFNKCNFRGRH